MQQNKNRQSEAGNVFLFILLGIVLFAALSFTVARGFRGNTTDKMTDRKADLAATEMINYAQRTERAVSRVRRKGCSENEISFENPSDPAYTFATRDECKIFNRSGGGLTLTEPPQNAGGSGASLVWRFSGAQNIAGSMTAGGDLAVYISINRQTCIAINDRLGITPAAETPVDASAVTFAKFVGTFASGNPPNNEDASIQEELTGCVNLTGSGAYIFYSTLLDR